MTATSRHLPLFPEDPLAALAPLAEPDGRPLLYDFCLMPYPAKLGPDRVAAVSVLLASFAHEGVLTEGTALVDSLLARLGPLCTVFGIKKRRESDELYWELYFYQRDHTPRGLSLEMVRPCFPCELDGRVPGDVDWQFFSVEVSKRELCGEGKATVTVYQEGQNMAWKLRDGGLELANLYKVFDARSEMPEFLAVLRASVHVPKHPMALATVLPPHLLECWRIWLAHKRFSDTIYWQRISTQKAEWALSWQKFPEPFVRRFSALAPKMRHVLWDVGADFARADATGPNDPGVVVRGIGLHAVF